MEAENLKESEPPETEITEPQKSYRGKSSPQ